MRNEKKIWSRPLHYTTVLILQFFATRPTLAEDNETGVEAVFSNSSAVTIVQNYFGLRDVPTLYYQGEPVVDRSVHRITDDPAANATIVQVQQTLRTLVHSNLTAEMSNIQSEIDRVHSLIETLAKTVTCKEDVSAQQPVKESTGPKLDEHPLDFVGWWLSTVFTSTDEPTVQRPDQQESIRKWLAQAADHLEQASHDVTVSINNRDNRYWFAIDPRQGLLGSERQRVRAQLSAADNLVRAAATARCD